MIKPLRGTFEMPPYKKVFEIPFDSGRSSHPENCLLFISNFLSIFEYSIHYAISAAVT
jgi:hypothetical protein